jgi:hypothetical protein
MTMHNLPAARHAHKPVAVTAAPLLDKLLAPVRTFRDLEQWLDRAAGDRWLVQLDRRRARENAAVARQWLAEMPSEAAIKAAIESFEDATTVQASRQHIRLVLSFLVDAFPNARLNCADAYLDGLAIVLTDDEHGDAFSAPVLAAAVKRLLVTSKFVPVPAEVVAEARSVRAKFHAGAVRGRHLLELRWSAEDVLIALGEITIDPDEIPF